MSNSKQITKVISGGQTGVDQCALVAAKELGIETGGMVPAGYRTEAGNEKEFLSQFGMTEAHTTRYEFRTHCNVRDSDGTLWVGKIGSPGFSCTLQSAKAFRKPFFDCGTTEDLIPEFVEWCQKKNIHVLNIAGNRASKLKEWKASVESVKFLIMEYLKAANAGVDHEVVTAMVTELSDPEDDAAREIEPPGRGNDEGSSK